MLHSTKDIKPHPFSQKKKNIFRNKQQQTQATQHYFKKNIYANTNTNTNTNTNYPYASLQLNLRRVHLCNFYVISKACIILTFHDFANNPSRNTINRFDLITKFLCFLLGKHD
eukprot:m.136370 g.136370  ORF g.136370 m.136370 type:complete len:113 (-) comp10639_c0_seq1:980-1318(-)